MYYFCALQEMDRIVHQMMHVAEYSGWDVTELRPVSTLCFTPNEKMGDVQRFMQIKICPLIAMV